MNRFRRRLSVGLSGSVALHVCGLVLLVWMARFGLRTAFPLRMPGTPHGQRMLLTYSVGSRAPETQSAAVQTATKKVAPTAMEAKMAAPSAPVKAASDSGVGASGDSALGDGDLNIALPQVHPRPTPDLSVLPRGASGNVVVDVVIDSTGKVVQETLVKGLGSAIDATVLQTLRGWVFTPATKDGQVVASEQEILIHYDRG